MIYISNIFILFTVTYIFFKFNFLYSLESILNLQGIDFIFFCIICFFLYLNTHIAIWYIIDEIRGVDKLKLTKKDIKLIKEIYKEIRTEELLEKQIQQQQKNQEQ